MNKAEGTKPVHERLRRLLFLVPFVAARPGVTVSTLAQELGLSTDELIEDLDLLAMVGRPPFQPDDFIDIYVENEKVYVDLDQRFSKPPRLTAAEASALAAAAALLHPAGDGALASALEKLERVLPAAARQRYLEMGKKLDVAAGGTFELGPLTRAILERVEVEFDYFASGRGQTERRTVWPRELFCHRGQWYLSAYCCARKDERLFRLDRLSQVVVTSRRFEALAADGERPPGFPRRTAGEVVVRFGAQAAPYVQERFGDQAKPLAGGGVEVRVTGDSERWLTQWILSFGGDAEVVEPSWARAAVARAAKASLESNR